MSAVYKRISALYTGHTLGGMKHRKHTKGGNNLDYLREVIKVNNKDTFTNEDVGS